MPEGAIYLTSNSSMSRDLMEDYLVVEDGKTKRFQDVPGYATKKFTEVFENRDPRMRQTFMTPGFAGRTKWIHIARN